MRCICMRTCIFLCNVYMRVCELVYVTSHYISVTYVAYELYVMYSRKFHIHFQFMHLLAVYHTTGDSD